MQLRLDLAAGPAPLVVLWELLEEERRRAAMALLSELIAQTINDSGEEVSGGE